MRTIVIVSSVVVLIIGVGYLATNSKNDLSTSQAVVGSAAEPVDEMAPDDQLESAAEGALVSTGGSYEIYDAEKIAQSDAKHIVLFFHATWCPGCRALDAAITENIAKIPAGVAIYKLDYDTETTLKQQYGITLQHSVIAVDKTGAAVGNITRPATLEDILTTL